VNIISVSPTDFSNSYCAVVCEAMFGQEWLQACHNARESWSWKDTRSIIDGQTNS